MPFTLAAPDTLVGLPRTDVRLISDGEQPAALVTYGKGLGAIAVIERAGRRRPARATSPLGGPAVGLDRRRHRARAAHGARHASSPSSAAASATRCVGSLPPNAAEAALRAVLA